VKIAPFSVINRLIFQYLKVPSKMKIARKCWKEKLKDFGGVYLKRVPGGAYSQALNDAGR